MDCLSVTASQACLCFVFFTSCVSFSFPAQKCGHFEFPNITQPLTAIEGAPLLMHFRLNTKGCKIPKNFSVHVLKRSSAKYSNVLCIFRHENGACLSCSAKRCACPEKPGGLYTCQKDIVRADDSTFLWTTYGDNIAEDARLILKVTTVRPSVRNLTISGHPESYLAVKGEDVDIVCDWENGVPPVSARLLGSEGKLFTSRNSSGQIQYRLSRVGCQDAGLIRCQAPGASHHKIARLLFKGPPEIDTENSTAYFSGKHLKLEFHVCDHTNTIRTCHLTRLAQNAKAQDCFGNSNITGTPPDLTLTVRLDNVRKEEEGQWRLELTNDVGKGQVEFEVIALDPRHVAHRAILVPVSWVWPLVGIVCTACVTFIVAVIARRHCHHRNVRRMNEPDAVVVRDLRRRPSLESHIYHEPDDVSSDNEDDVCIAPDNYLTPIPDKDVYQGQGQMSPDRSQPGRSNEDDQLIIPTEHGQSSSSPTQGGQIRSSHVTKRHGSSHQDSQRPPTPKSGQQGASYPNELFTKPGFIKQRLPSAGQGRLLPETPSQPSVLKPCDQNVGSSAKDSHRATKTGLRQPHSSEQGFRPLTGGTNNRQNPEHPPKICRLPAPKHTRNPHDDAKELKILSVLKNTFGPDNHIADVWLEGKEIHVTLKLNLEQVSSSLKRNSHGSNAMEVPVALPDDYLHPV